MLSPTQCQRETAAIYLSGYGFKIIIFSETCINIYLEEILDSHRFNLLHKAGSYLFCNIIRYSNLVMDWHFANYIIGLIISSFIKRIIDISSHGLT